MFARRITRLCNHVRFISVKPDNKYVESTIDTIFKCSLGEGYPYWPFSNAKQLANEYKYNESYNSTQERVDDLIINESAKSFGTGFATGVGGVISMPVGVPAALVASWILQARLSGSIAELYDHDTSLPTTKTRILLSMIDYPKMLEMVESGKFDENNNKSDQCEKLDHGDSITIKSSTIDKELLAKAGTEIGLSRLPLSSLIILQHFVMRNMLTQAAARTGATGVGKTIPILGGFVGGIVDTYTLNAVGTNSIKIFKN